MKITIYSFKGDQSTADEVTQYTPDVEAKEVSQYLEALKEEYEDDLTFKTMDSREFSQYIRELNVRVRKENLPNVMLEYNKSGKLSGGPLAKHLTSVCLDVWHRHTSKFLKSPDKYDIEDVGQNEMYEILKLSPGMDVARDAKRTVIDMAGSLEKSINSAFGTDVMTTEIIDADKKLEVLVGFDEGNGGVFQARGDFSSEAHATIFLTMPKERQLYKAFAAMTQAPKIDDGIEGDLETNPDELSVAGDVAPDYSEAEAASFDQDAPVDDYDMYDDQDLDEPNGFEDDMSEDEMVDELNKYADDDYEQRPRRRFGENVSVPNSVASGGAETAPGINQKNKGKHPSMLRRKTTKKRKKKDCKK